MSVLSQRVELAACARSHRVCQDNGRWYFFTREGALEGPFEDRVGALVALDKYVKATASPFAPSLGLALVPK